MPRVGLGRAAAVVIAACVPASRARAKSSPGLKYRPASDSVWKSQVFGGHGDTEWPRFFSSYDRRPGSSRFRDSNPDAVALATIGTGWYRFTAQPAKKKLPKSETIRFPITFIEPFSLQKE